MVAEYISSRSAEILADKEGIEILQKLFMLEAVNVGPNVVIEEPKDPFIFKETTDCAPGIKCTSEIQTYLDLYIADEREREAAEHLESYLLKDKWSECFKDEIW